MAVRCENCSKFASLEMGEPEVEGGVEIEGPDVSATVRLPRNCADCGNELQEVTFELQTSSDDLMSECPGEEADAENKAHEWDLPDVVSFETTERMDDKGGKIKAQRYMKKMLGVEATFNVVCNRCKQEATVTLKDETNAGSFENLN